MSLRRTENAATQDDGLPEGWTLTTLGEICPNPQYGWTTSAQVSKDGLKLLRTTDISSGVIQWSTVPVCKDEPHDVEKYLLYPGDIVVSRAGSVGVSWLIKDCPKAIFASYLIRLRTTGATCSPFVAFFMKSSDYWSAIADETAGIAIPNVNASKLKTIEIPLPPLPEQQRIVAKLETVLARVNNARERLARVPAILKRFRQSVLAAACSGRLTADWREQHPPLASAFCHDNSVTDEELPELPAGWQWNSLDSLGEDPRSTVQTGPFGAQLHRSEFTSEGIPVIAVGNLTGMGFSTDGLYYVSEQKARQLEKYDVQAGDVLFARSGATLGKVCVAPNFVNNWRMTGHILRVRLNKKRVHPNFVVYALHGDPAVKNQVFGNIRGMTRPGFNTSLLATIELPVPSLSEQTQIVRRVEGLFSLADTVEQRLCEATRRADKLTQSTLARAFRGELVPTEAELARAEGRSYESAAALLRRIQRDGGTLHTAPTNKRGRKPFPKNAP